MTTKRHNPLRCQRCHHKHATHSLLGTILLCATCYDKFINPDYPQIPIDFVSTPNYTGPKPQGLYHLD